MAQELAALHAALGLAANPALIDQARTAAFPPGVSLLLEIAAGDEDAIARCVASTSMSDDEIRVASEFFIEQVMLTERADSYRILGADRWASSATLRRNMALLMRWLHPDVSAQKSSGVRIDRTVFAERVTAAWEDLKNDDRRASYDTRAALELRQGQTVANMRPVRQTRSKGRIKAARVKVRGRPKILGKRTRRRRLEIVPVPRGSWVARILNAFRRR